MRPILCAALIVGATAAPRWREVSANGTWPDPRFSHTATLTADGRHMLLFGGNNFDAVNDLFAYDTVRSEWSKIKPSGVAPSKRYGHQTVVTADGRLIVFGGYNGTFLSDVHELTVDVADSGTLVGSWRLVATSGEAPAARDGHSAVLAPDGSTMLVYGGFDGKNQLNDLVALDTDTFEWSRPLLLPPTDASADAAATEAADEGSSDDAEAEGTDGEEGDEVDGSAGDLKDGEDDAAVPAARYQHSAVACSGGMMVYGGYLAGGEFADDLWRLTLESDGSGARWAKVRATGDVPGGTFGHAATSDADGSHMWLSGGFGHGPRGSRRAAFSDALHVLDTRRNRWSRVEARGARPCPRHKHTMVSTRRGQLLLFGGADFGPTRGFFELDASRVLEAARAGGPPTTLTAALALTVQLMQLFALLALAVASWLRRLGMIEGLRAAAAISASLSCIVAAERIAPPPGALVARALGQPKPGGRKQRTAAHFTRGGLNSATDVAAAVAAAGLASLLASGGGPPMMKYELPKA